MDTLHVGKLIHKIKCIPPHLVATGDVVELGCCNKHALPLRRNAFCETDKALTSSYLHWSSFAFIHACWQRYLQQQQQQQLVLNGATNLKRDDIRRKGMQGVVLGKKTRVENYINYRDRKHVRFMTREMLLILYSLILCIECLLTQSTIDNRWYLCCCSFVRLFNYSVYLLFCSFIILLFCCSIFRYIIQF